MKLLKNLLRTAKMYLTYLWMFVWTTFAFFFVSITLPSWMIVKLLFSPVAFILMCVRSIDDVDSFEMFMYRLEEQMEEYISWGVY